MKLLGGLLLLAFSGVSGLGGYFPTNRRSKGDFVKNVRCKADGMEITLKDELPIPRGGMWDMAVEGYPKCPGATKTDVGGGHTFTIFYSDKEWCGVDADYWLTPAWVAVAKVVLLLVDDNSTAIADSVSCVYDTRFETSLLTFRGEIASENLRYGGSLDEDGADVENTVHSSDSVAMDFFDQSGRALENRKVKLGDPIMFKIDVTQNAGVKKILPEKCYFSSSSIPEEDVLGGQTLPFVKKNCFNHKNGMVRAFLPQMERNYNGTTYEMRFPAFYFTGYSKNLFVHCTILACVGTNDICDATPECFGVNRRKREVSQRTRKYDSEPQSTLESEEVVMTKYIFIEDNRKGSPEKPARRGHPQVGYTNAFSSGTVCMETPHFSILMGSMIGCIVVLLVLVSCMGGRLARSTTKDTWAEKRLMYSNAYNAQPPTYSASVQSLPTITAF